MLDFVARRLEQLLVDGGCSIEVVKAVLSERAACPASAALSARELQVLLSRSSVLTASPRAPQAPRRARSPLLAGNAPACISSCAKTRVHT